MDVIEYTPTREQYVYTFGGAAPAMRIPPGTALRLWSDDAFGGALRTVDDLSSAKVDLRFVNPQTGPFYVEGAQPGDTLVLHLVSLEPARDWGASAAIPFFGGMTGTDRVVTLQEPLPDTTWIYELDRARNTVTFVAQHGDLAIDLVYNRLVDFAFTLPEHAALAAAYRDGAVAVTPNPHNHALHADKRNLTLLSDSAAIKAFGLADDLLARLGGIPRTVLVTPENAGSLWRDRKHLFFKPVSGYGGKAVYRGDKVTKRVWEEIAGGGYVAQTLVPPGKRVIELDGELTQRKMDIRLYTYGGQTLLSAARLYQGQTTNFRTPGGGIAPIFVM